MGDDTSTDDALRSVRSRRITDIVRTVALGAHAQLAQSPSPTSHGPASLLVHQCPVRRMSATVSRFEGGNDCRLPAALSLRITFGIIASGVVWSFVESPSKSPHVGSEEFPGV